jgi:four helix bundle protein
MSNIAEGFNAGSDAEFVRFLVFARRSNSEVLSLCYIALDMNYISNERFKSIYEKANLIERQISSLISYLSHPKVKAVKEPHAEYVIDIPYDNERPLEL